MGKRLGHFSKEDIQKTHVFILQRIYSINKKNNLVYDEAAKRKISRKLNLSIYLTYKIKIISNVFMTFTMNGLRGYYTESNKLVRERKIPYYFTNMWNLMNKINKQH